MKTKDITFISAHLFTFWQKIGIVKPDNHDEIVKFIINDIQEAADTKNWHSGDIDIAFRRWIEAQSDNQP